ncbi:MAG: LysM peptidoglycan-binding domain-containing protein, partial [Acidimicrobiia bacterium]
STDAAPEITSMGDDAAAVDVVAERIAPACPQTYTAAPGDSWYRIADEAGVSPSELLAENNATTATVILPGDDVCLPEGASMPSPPSTTVAPTTTVPDDEPEPATTTAPPTTEAPTTTAAPTENLSRSEVQELIRQTWPEGEVDKALEVARRESNYIATADNGWCCVGVFQIYWTVHRGWLDEFGITERSDLFDARKNIAAAYSMWQQQGWGPWGG